MATVVLQSGIAVLHQLLQVAGSLFIGRTGQSWVVFNSWHHFTVLSLFVSFVLCAIFVVKMLSSERVINYNKKLYGPGPVARMPVSGIRGYYARMPPLQGFSMAATHGVILGLATGLYYKYFMADVDTKKIEQYYRENPPR